MNRDEQRNMSTQDPDAVIVRETEVVIVPGDTDTTTDDTRSTADTSEIRADIEQTRAELSETIDALTERLSPSNLKEQAQEQFHDVKEQVKDQVKEQFYEAKEMVREATIGRVEHMVQSAGDTVNNTGSSVLQTIRQNPIPAALVGIGLGWLFMNRQSGASSQPTRYSGRGGVRGERGYYGERPYYEDRPLYGERPYYEGQRAYSYNTGSYGDQRDSGGMMQQGRQAVGNVASSVTDRASNVASTVSDTASNVASTVSDTASNVASTVSDTASNVASTVSDTASNVVDRAQYQAQRVEDRFENTLQDNPLALGAIAIALGTAVGLALPQTERENQLMGEARDTLVERAQEVASDTFDKVQRVAGEVASEAQTTVQEQAREQGLTS